MGVEDWSRAPLTIPHKKDFGDDQRSGIAILRFKLGNGTRAGPLNRGTAALATVPSGSGGGSAAADGSAG